MIRLGFGGYVVLASWLTNLVGRNGSNAVHPGSGVPYVNESSTSWWS